jgi:hypothetical protein
MKRSDGLAGSKCPNDVGFHGEKKSWSAWMGCSGKSAKSPNANEPSVKMPRYETPNNATRANSKSSSHGSFFIERNRASIS